MKNLTPKLCLLALLFTCTTAGAQIPKLNSFDTAASTIFLDFDGQTVQAAGWQNGQAFYCDPTILTTAEITEVFNRVSEDYRPFNINVTTDSVKFLNAPVNRRIRVIVTPTCAWFTGVGGIAYIGSFTWGDDTPVFVFPPRISNTVKNISEACSHESGHSLGLSHQSKYDALCNLTETYSTGAGAGETGWAPVMGNSYGKNMTGWNNGPTPYACAEAQDNLTIITSNNGFGYRTDDYEEALTAGTNNINPVAFSVNGIISTATDKDAFKFTLAQSGNMHIDATPFHSSATADGANLDIKLMLYNSSKTLLRTYNPAAFMNVTVDTTLPAGLYYIVVSGTGNSNTSSYGSLGGYTLSGMRGALPIHDVQLRGSNDKGVHNLSWSIIADEPIAAQGLEVSTNGFDFINIANINAGTNKFSRTAEKSGVYYYRLKATSVINQTMYSNIVALKAGSNSKIFSVGNFVQNNITINAAEGYQFLLTDVNGRSIATGKRLSGLSNIDISNQPGGIYIIQLMNETHTQTERILKQ